MHEYFFTVLSELLQTKGINPEELLANVDISADGPADSREITAARLNKVCGNALALSQDPLLGLKFGSKINIPAQGIFGYALMTCATVDDALKILLRYNRAILPSINIELLENEDKLQLIAHSAHLPENLSRFFTDVLFAAIINSGRILTGIAPNRLGLELDFQPADTALYYATFGDNIQFNSNKKALSFDIHDRELPISTANPIAQDIFRRECDRLLEHEGQRGAVSERVRQLLLQAGTEFPTSAKVAKALHMSESTLQRKLHKENCRYQELLDQVRYRLAQEYLLGTTLPVSEIALLLGFSDATNFRRSFKRWSGTTPSKIRDNQQVKPN